MNETTLRAIAADFGPDAELIRDGAGRFLVRTSPWDWTVEPVEPPAAVLRSFAGEMYMASPDVYTSGGGGLRSRWFAVDGDQVLSLDREPDMRRFLRQYASMQDPYALAELLERCQGTGRVGNVYRTNGLPERWLDEHSRATLRGVGVSEPLVVGDQLEFFSWRIIMNENWEVIELEQWTLTMSDPDGPRWSSVPVAGRLNFG